MTNTVKYPNFIFYPSCENTFSDKKEYKQKLKEYIQIYCIDFKNDLIDTNYMSEITFCMLKDDSKQLGIHIKLDFSTRLQDIIELLDNIYTEINIFIYS